MQRIIAGAVAALALTLGLPWMGTAQANPLTCEHRSAAHVSEHGGKAADDAYHVSRGELPNCDADSEADGSRRATAPPEQSSGTEQRHDDNREDKSRYCRRHWFC